MKKLIIFLFLLLFVLLPQSTYAATFDPVSPLVFGSQTNVICPDGHYWIAFKSGYEGAVINTVCVNDGEPQAFIPNDSVVDIGMWSFCETNDYINPSPEDLAACESDPAYVTTSTLQVIPAGNAYMNEIVQLQTQASVQGISNSALSTFGQMIPISAILLISVGVVYFVIKHFRGISRVDSFHSDDLDHTAAEDMMGTHYGFGKGKV